MGENDDGGGVIGLDLSQSLLRPGHDHLVRAGKPVAGRELASRVGHDRAPAKEPGGRAQGLGRVHRPVDEQAGRRPVHVAEDLDPGCLHDPASVLPDQRLCLGEDLLGNPLAVPLAALDNEDVRPQRLALDHGEEDSPLLPLDRS